MGVAETTTRIVRVIEVPRSQLADFIKMPKSQQVGVYFLIMAGKFPAPWGVPSWVLDVPILRPLGRRF